MSDFDILAASTHKRRSGKVRNDCMSVRTAPTDTAPQTGRHDLFKRTVWCFLVNKHKLCLHEEGKVIQTLLDGSTSS